LSIEKKILAAPEGGGGGVVELPELSRVAAPGVTSMDIVNRLLAADVDVNAGNEHVIAPAAAANSGRFGDGQKDTGCTPLYRATEAGDWKSVRTLLDRGAKPERPMTWFHRHS